MSFVTNLYDKIDFATLNILETATYYGLECKKSNANTYKANCCFHNERTASLFIYAKTNTFKCYGCNAKGAVWQFVSLQEKTDDKKVIIEKIREIYNFSATSAPFTSATKPKPMTEKEPQKPKELVTSYHAVYKDVLNFCSQNPNSKAYDYLTKERKLSPQIIDKAMIRTFWGKQLESYLRGKYNVDDLRKFGFVSEKDYFYFTNYHIVIPYYDTNCKIFQLQFRTLTPTDKEPKYRFLAGLPLGGYNLHNLAVSWNVSCAITEGVFDCLSLYELNNYLHPEKRFEVVLALPSATLIDKSLLETLKKQNLTVTLFVDNDKAGEKVVKDITELEKKIGLNVKFRKFPNCKDVNEFWVNRSKELQKV
jgi:DNA primase